MSAKATLAPKELAFPAVVASVSAACIGGAAAFVAVDPENLGHWFMALWPVFIGLMIGVAALGALIVRWHSNRGRDRLRRAAWIAITALLLSPSVVVAYFLCLS